MKYMLDTNILIYFIKNKPTSVAEHINQLPASDTLCMSYISYAELLKGAYDSQRQEKVLQQLTKLISMIPVVYIDSPVICDHYAKHAAQLKRQGTIIGSNDLWIASHALALDCTLVTNNLKEFERVTDLPLQNWV